MKSAAKPRLSLAIFSAEKVNGFVTFFRETYSPLPYAERPQDILDAMTDTLMEETSVSVQIPVSSLSISASAKPERL